MSGPAYMGAATFLCSDCRRHMSVQGSRYRVWRGLRMRLCGECFDAKGAKP